jgi:diaminopimelate decarboxylase
MNQKLLPFTEETIRALVKQFPTPFHVYGEDGIRATARKLVQTFDWVPRLNGVGYINYFAVKATPNPHILMLLAEEGMGADASSGPEIALSEAAGLTASQIMFTSNNTAAREYREAYDAGAIINLDDIRELDVLISALNGTVPETLSFRYNPGRRKSTGANFIIGVPEEAKFGVPDSQLTEAYRRAKGLGVKHFGLHTMVVSNELDATQHVATAIMLFEKVVELSRELDITFDFVNLGGGLGIPYRPEQQAVDYGVLRHGIEQAYQRRIIDNGLSPLRVVTENGRHVTGPNGYLIATVRSIKDTFYRYVGLDASMADLMRPGLYDAYHEITVLGKLSGKTAMQRVVGSLCENNDFFSGAETKDRELPIMEVGDIVVIHDTGAHGHSMGFNYNGKLRSAEILLQRGGTAREIRRAETRADLFATLDFPGLSVRG